MDAVVQTGRRDGAARLTPHRSDSAPPPSESTDAGRAPARGRVATLVLVALAARLLGLAVYEGLLNDATGRVVVVQNWLASGRSLFSLFGTQVWPDGNYLLPGLILSLGGDPYWAMRIVYALIGVANVALLYHFGRRLVTEQGAWVGALLLAVTPFHVVMSLDGAMGEITSFTLSLLGMSIVWDQRRAPRFGPLVAAGLCFAVASMFRYEALLWSALIGLTMLIPPDRRLPTFREPRRLAAVAVLGVISGLYLFALVARWTALHGDPFYFKSAFNTNVSQFFVEGQHSTWPWYIYKPFATAFWVLNTFTVVTPLVALAGFAGLWMARRRPATLPFVIAYVCFVASSAYAATRPVPLTLQPRYGLSLFALVLPFVHAGVLAARARWRPLTPSVVYGVLAASFVATYAGYAVLAYRDMGILSRRLAPLSLFRPGQYATRDLVQWLESDAGAGARAIVSPCATSTYLQLARQDVVRSGRVRPFSIYLDDWKVHDRASYTQAFAQAARGYDVAVFRDDCPGLGFTDGVQPDPFQPPAGDTPYERGGLLLTPRHSAAPLRIFGVSAR